MAALKSNGDDIFGGVVDRALFDESLKRSYSILRGGFKLRAGRGSAEGGNDDCRNDAARLSLSSRPLVWYAEFCPKFANDFTS